MRHRSHYKPKRSPGESPWGMAAVDKSASAKDASGTPLEGPGADQVPAGNPAVSPTKPSIPAHAAGTTVEPRNDSLPEGIREDGRVLVRTQR